MLRCLLAAQSLFLLARGDEAPRHDVRRELSSTAKHDVNLKVVGGREATPFSYSFLAVIAVSSRATHDAQIPVHSVRSAQCSVHRCNHCIVVLCR